MTCAHQSIKDARPGQEDACILCKLPIIFTSTGRWTWLYAISEKERKALKIVFNVDNIVSKSHG